MVERRSRGAVGGSAERAQRAPMQRAGAQGRQRVAGDRSAGRLSDLLKRSMDSNDPVTGGDRLVYNVGGDGE